LQRQYRVQQAHDDAGDSGDTKLLMHRQNDESCPENALNGSALLLLCGRCTGCSRYITKEMLVTATTDSCSCSDRWRHDRCTAVNQQSDNLTSLNGCSNTAIKYVAALWKNRLLVIYLAVLQCRLLSAAVVA
jgi:hypothetical protein